MSRFVNYLFVFLTISCTLCNWVIAQQITCPNAAVMQNVNLTKFVGTWYEVARNPDIPNMGCTEIDFRILSDNKTLGVTITYVNTTDKKWVNSTMAANITLNYNTNGYNVSFSSGDKAMPYNMLKLLDTDYSNYALLCGYSNAADASTYFGAVLTRQRMPNSTNLSSYEGMGNNKYTNFSNMTTLTQSQKCYRSSASTPLPMLATILTIIYTYFKFIY